mgnify:FL=1
MASHFYEQVYDVVRLVPRGRVTTYGAIAEYLSLRSAARMVGWALRDSLRKDQNVPAHRVVNRKGLLTGRHHFDPPEKMTWMLQEEGVPVRDFQIDDFKAYFWDPIKEL